MKISNCKINHLSNPLGCKLNKTVFSWISDCENVISSRIIVKSENEIIKDTDWSELDAVATNLELKLNPRTVYNWTVSVKDTEGRIATSESQFFETGKMDESWSGKWIRCKEGIERNPVFFRKIKLNRNKQIKKARLYICGLGLYEAYIDGKKIGDAYLTPGFYAYNLWNQVQTYDITANMRYLEDVEVSSNSISKEISVLKAAYPLKALTQVFMELITVCLQRFILNMMTEQRK